MDVERARREPLVLTPLARAHWELVPVWPALYQWRPMRVFLWIAIIGWAVGLGAKLFDLVVVAGAWSASPPESFALLPYGKRYPVDPGDFFIPLSALIAIGSVGALVCGWRSQAHVALWVAVVMFLVIWATTPTVFWPMIRELYGTAIGRITPSAADSIRLAHRWVVWDSLRVAWIAAGFVASVRALANADARPVS